MQKLILEAVKEFRKTYPDLYRTVQCDGYVVDGTLINYKYERVYGLENFLKQALTNAFEAGQKSREKEIVEKIKNSKTPEKLIKEQYECYDFDEAEVYALENEIIENIIKSLSLTKESK